MAYQVREHQPRGLRWKLPLHPRALLLEFPIRLEEVMEAQHPAVVGRARQTVESRRSRKLGQDPLGPGSYPPGKRHLASSSEPRYEVLESLGSHPHPSLGWVYVAKHPQDSIPIGGPGWK